ncbi:MAG: hypothetical protein ACKV2T_07910 [Kofleriaceae bacterium]
MSFRDDHDAAIARADALERELAKAREDAAAKDALLDDAERENQRLGRELEDTRSQPALAPVEKPAKQRTPGARQGNERPWWSIPHRERPVAYYARGSQRHRGADRRSDRSALRMAELQLAEHERRHEHRTEALTTAA